MDDPTNYHQQQLLSLASKSKPDFVREYAMYDEATAEGVYLQAVNELTKAITEGNVDSFKKLSILIDYMGGVKGLETLSGYYNNASNPIRNTNLVILACKQNKLEILKSILDNLSVYVGNGAITPNDKDETRHGAFYYAIRSGNVKLIDTLITSWPDDYFTTRPDELDELISKAYEELKLTNVPLSDDIEIFVENRLINLRFFSNSPGHIQTSKVSLSNIKERVDLVLDMIALLNTEYLHEKEVDDKFVFIIKCIALNIHVLKQQLRSTYDRLPWEEIEFCLVSFVSCHVKRQEINLVFRSTLNKNKILGHLGNFANKLEDTMGIIADVGGIGKLSVLPKLQRSEVVGNCTQFKELYNDYQQVRDIHSLEKIYKNINLSSSADPTEREGQLIIMRVLQVIGENLKNTLESPKLSNTTSELLILSLPKYTRKIIVDLRNSLSHSYSLSKRTQIEQNNDVRFFAGVQNDITKIGVVAAEILYNNKIKLIRLLLEKVVTSNSIDEMKEVATVLRTVDLEAMKPENCTMTEHEKLDKLIKELSDSISDKTIYEQEMFNKMNRIINEAAVPSENIKSDYFTGFLVLKVIFAGFGENMIDHNLIRKMKVRAKQELKNMIQEIAPCTLKEIAKLSVNISRSVQPRMQTENLDKLKGLVSKICYIAEFGMGDIKYIEGLRAQLNDKGSSSSACSQTSGVHLKAEIYIKQLTLKMSELKEILKNKFDNFKSTNTLSLYKKDTKLQAIVEMLVLDIMSILGRTNNYLENNLLFLDDNSPLLNGKCLRNHLAHDNALVDILLSDPSILVILNAKKLTEENVMANKKTIGKLVNDDPSKLKEKYNQGLVNIIQQERMFVALEEGSLEGLKDCLKEGADINARNINSWTTLHFAAKGPSLEVIQFVLDQSLHSNVKDTNGQGALHVAAAYGRSDIVEFLLKEAAFYVGDLDNMGRTPLHLAAQNGHKDTVEVLLENKANTNTQEIMGVSALHYSIRNNHIDVAKMLLAKEVNVDINEAMGGLTPLYIAAESGYLELVNFLLQNKADVNVRINGAWTPLHTATLNGHLEVAKALILNGSDVNARVINGCTALHFAVEYGHEKLVSILLAHGANVNAADKTYNNTPLIYAAKYGYIGIVEILLVNGASVDTVGYGSCLHCAAENNHLELVNILLKHGVTIDTKDKNEATPLFYAVQNGHKEIANLLMKHGADVNAKTDKGLTPLHVAAIKGYKSIADLLIRNGARLGNEDIMGATPLHAAADSGSIDVIDLLIKNESNIRAKTIHGQMPLHFAAWNGHLAATHLLIANKADVNAEVNTGLTPLHAAAVGGHIDVVGILIENNAQIDAKDMDDCTPLHLAVAAGHKDIVEILVENGANINVESKKSTPLHFAIKYNRKEIVEVLVANGAEVNKGDTGPLELAVLAGYREMVEILLKSKADLNTRGPANITPLHLAAARGHTEIVNVLIKGGADIHAKADNNVTPLYLAAEEGYDAVAEILIRNGAGINVINAEDTPLYTAAVHGHDNVVKVLLSNGAKINIKDVDNRTPLELAVSRGHVQVVKMLLRHEKVDMNYKGNGDFTILHIASQESNLEMVKFLVAEGSDMDAITATGLKPIHIASGKGHKDTVAFFLSKGLGINEPGKDNQTVLHYAAMAGQLEVVEYLISEGANVIAQDASGISPIHFAAHFGRQDVVEVLLKHGAVYNAVDKLHRTPLSISRDPNVINLLTSTDNLFKAVKGTNSSVVERCLEKGAFVNAKNADGATPLHYAACEGCVAIVNMLLQNKADPNAAMNNGITPLHHAAKYSHSKVVMALLSNGAVYNYVADSGKMPVDYAVDKDITSLFQLVAESFKNVKKGNSKIINDLNRIRDLSMIKAVMGARNKENETLVVAAIHSDFSKIDQLKEISQGNIASQINKALILVTEGDYVKALSIFTAALENRKEILGPDNPGTLEIQVHIANVLLKQGFYEKALNAFEDIFQTQRDILGVDNKDTLSTWSLIAFVLYKLVENEKAYNIFQEVYKKQTKILGSNHLDTLDTLFRMALVLTSQGKHEEALNANRMVFEKMKEIFGANASVTLSIQNNIAVVLTNQCKYEEALQIYKEVYEQNKKVCGNHHSDTFGTLYNIADVYFQQEKYQQALLTYQEVLNIQNIVMAPNHPDVLSSKYRIASVFFAQGKWIGALKSYRECLNQLKTVFGPSHPFVLDTLQRLQLININLKIEGHDESNILQYLQKDINIAASTGDTQALQRLIKNGTDVNDKDTDGRTPLHYAISNGRIDIINILLKAGADVTQVTNKGNTTLHTATSKGYNEIVDVLLQHVSRDKLHDFVNAKTTGTGTASLHVAVKNGYLDIVISLLKHGAIYEIKDKANKEPLDFCKDQRIADLLKLIRELFKDAKNGNIEIVSKLKTVKPDELLALKNVRNGQCNTLLQVVMNNKHTNIASKIQEIFNIDGHQESKDLPYLEKDIYIAARNGDTQALQRLIQNGTDVNDKDADGRTPLHYAISNGRIDIINILLKARADVTQVTNKGNTTLHTATSKGYNEIVDVLLQHVSRDKLHDFVNAKTTGTGTASLHVAVKNGYLDIVISLLKHGAIYEIKDKANKEPLDFCKDQRIADLLKLIRELFKDAKNGNIEIVSKLKTVKPDELLALEKVRNSQGNTLLQVVIINNHKNIASKLIEILKTPNFCGKN